MSKMRKAMLSWRAKQKRGAIMKPSTFENIEERAMRGGLSKASAKRVAGSAYWKTAGAKYNRSKHD
jgi:hypothetical protein